MNARLVDPGIRSTLLGAFNDTSVQTFDVEEVEDATCQRLQNRIVPTK